MLGQNVKSQEPKSLFMSHDTLCLRRTGKGTDQEGRILGCRWSVHSYDLTKFYSNADLTFSGFNRENLRRTLGIRQSGSHYRYPRCPTVGFESWEMLSCCRLALEALLTAMSLMWAGRKKITLVTRMENLIQLWRVPLQSDVYVTRRRKMTSQGVARDQNSVIVAWRDRQWHHCDTDGNWRQSWGGGRGEESNVTKRDGKIASLCWDGKLRHCGGAHFITCN